MDSLRMSVTVRTDPKTLYSAWLDSNEHGSITGSQAKIDPKVNGKFSVWDGYITGKTVELDPFKRIVQHWRTTDFPDGAPYSVLEIRFEGDKEKTKLTLVHTGIPDGQGEEYKQGWKDYYFSPMKAYYAKTSR